MSRCCGVPVFRCPCGVPVSLWCPGVPMSRCHYGVRCSGIPVLSRYLGGVPIPAMYLLIISMPTEKQVNMTEIVSVCPQTFHSQVSLWNNIMLSGLGNNDVLFLSCCRCLSRPRRAWLLSLLLLLRLLQFALHSLFNQLPMSHARERLAHFVFWSREHSRILL